MDRDKILERWEESRKRANYPTLKNPKIVDSMEGGASMNFLTGEVSLGASFIDEITETGKIDEDSALSGVFDHEIEHYMGFPRNLATAIRIGHFSQRVFKELGNHIFQLYADMVVDTSSVLKSVTRDDCLAMRTSSQETLDGADKKIRGMNLEYLYKQAGREGFKSEVPEKLEELMQIDFATARDHETELYMYGKIVETMIDKQYGAGYNGKGEALDQIIKRASKREIGDALRDIMKDVSKDKFEKIREWVKGIRGEALPKSRKAGKGSSELNEDDDTARYYAELSKAYPLVITKRPRKAVKNRRVFGETEKVRLGKDTNLILPHSSGGKILPGVTRSIRIEERPKQTTDYLEPNAVVEIDSSGSMPDPKSQKSYAALGASIVGRSYWARGRYVGGLNFDSESSVLPFTRDLQKIFRFFTAYKGGGTEVDLDALKRMLGIRPEMVGRMSDEMIKDYVKDGRLPRNLIKKNVDVDVDAMSAFLDRKIDVYMFTDGDIGNQEAVLEYLAGLDNLHRAAIILTNGNRDSYEEYSDRIAIHTVKDERDLPKITVREAEKSLLYSD